VSDPVFRRVFALPGHAGATYPAGMALLRCAKCGRTERKPVVYGYPSPETLEKARRGEVVLGGCEIGGPPEPWWCDDCEPEEPWNDLGKRAPAEERSSGEGE